MDTPQLNLIATGTQAGKLQQWATLLVVSDVASRDDAITVLKQVAAFIAAVKDQKEHFYRPAKISADNIAAMFNPVLELAEEIKKTASKKVGDFEAARQAAEQAKLDEEAKQRQEQELARQIEEERLAKERAAALTGEAGQQAAALADAGLGDIAAAVTEQAGGAAQQILADQDATADKALAKAGKVEVAAKTVTTATGAGFTLRKVKNWRLVDIKKVPHMYLEIKAGAVREAMNAGTPIPGIEYFEENSSQVR